MGRVFPESFTPIYVSISRIKDYGKNLVMRSESEAITKFNDPAHYTKRSEAEFCITLGIKEVFLERSGRKIWVKPEPRAEPFIPCYTPRTKRSVVRAQRGRAIARSSKNIFRFYIYFDRLPSINFFNAPRSFASLS